VRNKGGFPSANAPLLRHGFRGPISDFCLLPTSEQRSLPVFGQKRFRTKTGINRPSRFLDRLAPLCRCPRETGVSRSFLYLAEGGEPGTFMQAASEKEKGRPEPESGRKTPRSGGRAD
jgi:hypothetical protein